MIRIGIIGTYSVGKTTLTRALSQAIPGSTPIEENVRIFVKEHFKKNGIGELSPEEFVVLEHLLYEEQVLSSRNATCAIIDSTPIGCPVYLENYHLLTNQDEKIATRIIDAWRVRAEDTLKEYDLIVYIPPEIPYEDDGFRSSPIFRDPIDNGFKDMIKDHPRVIEVSGYYPNDIGKGVNERVATILDYLRVNHPDCLS